MFFFIKGDSIGFVISVLLAIFLIPSCATKYSVSSSSSIGGDIPSGQGPSSNYVPDLRTWMQYKGFIGYQAASGENANLDPTAKTGTTYINGDSDPYKLNARRVYNDHGFDYAMQYIYNNRTSDPSQKTRIGLLGFGVIADQATLGDGVTKQTKLLNGVNIFKYNCLIGTSCRDQQVGTALGDDGYSISGDYRKRSTSTAGLMVGALTQDVATRNTVGLAFNSFLFAYDIDLPENYSPSTLTQNRINGDRLSYAFAHMKSNEVKIAMYDYDTNFRSARMYRDYSQYGSQINSASYYANNMMLGNTLPTETVSGIASSIYNYVASENNVFVMPIGYDASLYASSSNPYRVSYGAYAAGSQNFGLGAASESMLFGDVIRYAENKNASAAYRLLLANPIQQDLLSSDSSLQYGMPVGILPGAMKYHTISTQASKYQAILRAVSDTGNTSIVGSADNGVTKLDPTRQAAAILTAAADLVAGIGLRQHANFTGNKIVDILTLTARPVMANKAPIDLSSALTIDPASTMPVTSTADRGTFVALQPGQLKNFVFNAGYMNSMLTYFQEAGIQLPKSDINSNFNTADKYDLSNTASVSLGKDLAAFNSLSTVDKFKSITAYVQGVNTDGTIKSDEASMLNWLKYINANDVLVYRDGSAPGGAANKFDIGLDVVLAVNDVVGQDIKIDDNAGKPDVNGGYNIYYKCDGLTQGACLKDPNRIIRSNIFGLGVLDLRRIFGSDGTPALSFASGAAMSGTALATSSAIGDGIVANPLTQSLLKNNLGYIQNDAGQRVTFDADASSRVLSNPLYSASGVYTNLSQMNSLVYNNINSVQVPQFSLGFGDLSFNLSSGNTYNTLKNMQQSRFGHELSSDYNLNSHFRNSNKFGIVQDYAGQDTVSSAVSALSFVSEPKEIGDVGMAFSAKALDDSKISFFNDNATSGNGYDVMRLIGGAGRSGASSGFGSANPYSSLLFNNLSATGGSISYKLSNLKVGSYFVSGNKSEAFSAFDPSLKLTNIQNRNSIAGMQFAYQNPNVLQNSKLIADVGIASETGSFLGSKGAVGLGIASAQTHFLRLGVVSSSVLPDLFSDKLKFAANFSYGITGVQNEQNALLSGFSDLHTTSYNVSTHYAISKDKNISLFIAQPVRITQGTAMLSNGVSNSQISLVPFGREIDLGLSYILTTRFGTVSASAVNITNYGNIAANPTQQLLLLRFDRKI